VRGGRGRGGGRGGGGGGGGGGVKNTSTSEEKKKEARTRRTMPMNPGAYFARAWTRILYVKCECKAKGMKGADVGIKFLSNAAMKS